MQIIENCLLHEPPANGVALTIGSFDGFHLGHRLLLDALIGDSRVLGGPAAVMTLKPHPRQFFCPENAPNILTSDAQKHRLLQDAGVDLLYVLPFDAAMASMDRAAFLRDIVVGRCGARRLVVGHDFRFGRGAAGNYEYLCEAAPQLGFTVRQVDALFIKGQCVSSTLVRELILLGEVESVATYLGRLYAIEGEVVQGRGLGRKFGFPTANISPHNSALPAHGVYAATAKVDNATWFAAVNIGIAPTVRQEEVIVEAHLLDFSGDLSGRTMEITFHKRLRPEMKFSNLEALIQAINADVNAVRHFFVNQ